MGFEDGAGDPRSAVISRRSATEWKIATTGYPGQSALKCVLPAIQSVVDKGFVDEKAIGIQGHSWGGYQIAYMVTQTNRFRAVAAGAPVVNMISAYDGIRWGTGLPRQFQYERTQSRIGGSIWQYPTRFIENSPIFWADRVQTPVMILQNDGDDAVPWYQGVEFFLALRRLGQARKVAPGQLDRSLPQLLRQSGILCGRVNSFGVAVVITRIAGIDQHGLARG